MARRNDHSREELKEMALCAAEQIVDQQGIAALSTRKVAAAIGYSVGSLYLVFKNLDDLCWQLNARTLDKLLDEVSDMAASDAHQALLDYAHHYLAFSRQWPQRWSLLFEHSTAGEQAPEWLLQRIEQLFERLEELLQQLFPQASAIQTQQAARTLWSGVHGIAVLVSRDKLFAPDTSSATQMVDGLVARYIAGWQLEVKGTGAGK